MDVRIADWCFELNLTGHIDERSVKTAYRAQMRIHHPDKHYGDDGQYKLATEKSKAINGAYLNLSELIEATGPLGEVPAHTAAVPRQRPARPHSEPRHVYRERRFTPGFPDPAVFEMFVKSSNILSVGYSVPNRVIYIKFHDGSVYRYDEVPRSAFDSLLQSDSLGRYAHKNIYNKYRYARC